MDKPGNNLSFKLMSVTFKVRDLLLPRGKILREVEIEPGAVVLDYGCGPGSYTIEVAKMVGAKGKVYAPDIHRPAIEAVQKKAAKRALTNIKTIHSDCATGLENESVDVALLYDTFHDLSERKAVLDELHRVLKRDGILSFNDHHMTEKEITRGLTQGGLFKLARKGKRTYTFRKKEG